MTMKAWHPEKRNPISRKRRFWDLGADLNNDGCLRIYRLPTGGSKEGNRCLQLHQMDTVQNPEVLEIINEGSGNSLIFRDAPGGTLQARVDSDGDFFGVSFNTTSAEALKENFKEIRDSTAEKIIKNLKVKSWNFKSTPSRRQVGPTAENFKDVTGYGKGEAVDTGTLLGLTVRMLQFLYKKVTKLEARLDLMESQNTEAPPPEV